MENPADLRFSLQKLGIEIEYKHKRTTNEIEGVSFHYNNISFKGSQIDRKFSFGNLKKEFDKNILAARKQAQEEYLQQQAVQKAKLEIEEKVRRAAEVKPNNPTIGGVELTSEQWHTLQDGGFIYLEKMIKKDNSGNFSAYVFLNEEKNKAFFSSKNPDEFIKYGKYEMRVRDRILIEKGYITKAKVKWYGIGTFAYPYLWKTNKSDVDFQESWGDPRLPKNQKAEKGLEKQKNILNDSKKRKGRKI